METRKKATLPWSNSIINEWLGIGLYDNSSAVVKSRDNDDQCQFE